MIEGNADFKSTPKVNPGQNTEIKSEVNAENEWVSYKNKWYYAGSDGAILTDKWESINGKDYYFNSNGDLLVNTVVDGYNVDANGVKIK